MNQIKKYRVVIPGELTDAIYSNSDDFINCRELLALSERSVNRSCRSDYNRKWKLDEIESVLVAINFVLSNTEKYPDKCSKEYKMFVQFKEHLNAAKNS